MTTLPQQHKFSWPKSGQNNHNIAYIHWNKDELHELFQQKHKHNYLENVSFNQCNLNGKPFAERNKRTFVADNAGKLSVVCCKSLQFSLNIDNKFE